MLRKSSSPRGGPCCSYSFSKYFNFGDFGDFSDFFNLEGSLKDANDMLLPFEKIAFLALSFLSNSFCSNTRLSGGVGPDFDGVLFGNGGVGTSFTNICSGTSVLGDSS